MALDQKEQRRISRESEHRTRQRDESLRLLYSRRQAGDCLGGISISSVIRLEKSGRLTAVKLTPGGLTFYRATEVHGLAQR